MVFLSLREWLARWPRQLRFYALALSLLAAIAPSWHVCALSGHIGHAAGHQHGQGQGQSQHQFAVARNADGSPGPFICACASHYEKKIAGNRFESRPAALDHVNCLALLLQNLPAQIAAPFELREFAAPRALYCEVPVEIAAFETSLTRRGRAPPLEC